MLGNMLLLECAGLIYNDIGNIFIIQGRVNGFTKDAKPSLLF